MNDFELTDQQRRVFESALRKCGESVDLYGWRYNKELGADEYTPIDINDKSVQHQFFVCIKFLRSVFPYKGPKETIDSVCLRDAAEVWWDQTQHRNVSIDNGVMLVACVACGMVPKDLWWSMEISQIVMIPLDDWRKFCEDFAFSFDWERFTDSVELY